MKTALGNKIIMQSRTGIHFPLFSSMDAFLCQTVTLNMRFRKCSRRVLSHENMSDISINQSGTTHPNFKK